MTTEEPNPTVASAVRMAQIGYAVLGRLLRPHLADERLVSLALPQAVASVMILFESSYPFEDLA
jgi:hypothetical protein